MKIARRKNHRHPVVVSVALVACAIVTGLVFFFLRQPTETEPQATSQNSSEKSTVIKKETLLLPRAQTPIPLPIKASLLERPSGLLVLVNKTDPIDLAYVPSDLVLPSVPYRTDKTQEEVMVRKALVQPLADMFAAAKAEGIELLIGSAYRSSTLQATYFNSYAAASGQAEAEKYSAHPGTSEHQLGLAVDLTATDRVCYLVECFEGTTAGKWLSIRAHDYGFILRYPKSRTESTGYHYEPWHFRYIGATIATAIFESNMTYEEAYPYLSGEKKP